MPFIKVKTFDLTQHLAPYLLKEIEKRTDYPVELILSHMSDMSLPTPPYLLDRKVIEKSSQTYSDTKKIAVHLHTYYVDLLEDFLKQFENFHFTYDLFLTTDSEEKKQKFSLFWIGMEKLLESLLLGIEDVMLFQCLS